jgi:hypothetical protein
VPLKISRLVVARAFDVFGDQQVAVVLPSVTVTLTPTVVVPSSSVAENENWWTPTCASAGVQLNVVVAVPVPLAAGRSRRRASRGGQSHRQAVVIRRRHGETERIGERDVLFVPAGFSAIVAAGSPRARRRRAGDGVLQHVVLKACASVS